MRGGFRPSTWSYQIELPRPSGEPIKRRSTAPGVVHVKWGESSTAPWTDRSPLKQAGVTSEQLAAIERSLGQDATIPTGMMLPVPDGASAVQVDAARDALSTGKGSMTLLETTKGGFGAGTVAAPEKD